MVSSNSNINHADATKSDGLQIPSCEADQEVLLDAWREVLGQILTQQRFGKNNDSM
jgi:hypothetical protein